MLLRLRLPFNFTIYSSLFVFVLLLIDENYDLTIATDIFRISRYEANTEKNTKVPNGLHHCFAYARFCAALRRIIV